jgi:hypothetical protein
MREEDVDEKGEGREGRRPGRRKGLLHPKVKFLLISVCGVLEMGEKVL